MKCSVCKKRKAKFVDNLKEPKLYLCEECARKLLFEGKLVVVYKIELLTTKKAKTK